MKSFLSFIFPYPVHIQTFSSRNNVYDSCRLIQAVLGMLFSNVFEKDIYGSQFVETFWFLKYFELFLNADINHAISIFSLC